MSQTEIDLTASSSAAAEEARRLYELLPALYRVRDAGLGEPLQALLSVIGAQARLVEDDISGLYDNWFIETCRDWVVPYLGDLLGVRGVGAVGPGAGGQRAFVANTLRYRRGKGTIATLEQVARDLSGWPAHAVEFFLLLAATQNVNHVRPGSGGTVDVRDAGAAQLIGTAFDPTAHLVDVRHVDIGRGRHNIPHVGVFLWRLGAYPIELSPASPAGAGRYRFTPLGHDAPLFSRPLTEASGVHLATETNVPAPLRTGALSADLRTYRERFADVDPGDRPAETVFYGPDRSFAVLRGGDKVAPIDIMCADLSRWDRPPAGKVAVDVRSGRLAFAEGEDPTDVRVSFAYGFAADLGGGPYDRRAAIAPPPAEGWARTVSRTDPGANFDTLAAALAAWADPADGDRLDGVITVTDNDSYAETLSLDLRAGSLVIQAADQHRPLIRLIQTDGSVGELRITGGAGETASLSLDGFLIEGGIRVEARSLGSLVLRNCTMVPGRSLDPAGRPQHPDLPSIAVDAPNERLHVTLDRSIVGPIRIPAEAGGLVVRDGIVDSPGSRRIPVLVSGPLTPFTPLSSATPTIDVTIGAEGPHPASLSAVPGSLTEARDLLQAAIRTSSSTGPFANATVLARNNRLVVVPGSAESVRIEAAGADPTATELRLDPASARDGEAMVTGALTPFPSMTAAAPQVGVAMRSQSPIPVTFASVPTSIAQARDELEAAIRGADPDPVFAQALVVQLYDRLAVVPGTGDGWVRFAPTDADATTFVELALEDRPPAIAGPGSGSRGPEFGPATMLEQVTVFGGCFIRQLDLASNVIFTEPVLAERRQEGCTRFTFVPEGSRVPRRYHCQPAPGASVAPLFDSTAYGQPSYARLASTCPPEIATGADDEGEIGAFHLLQEPQRIENLRRGLDEYLPFGLEAGMFFVT
ncbi:MAG TPA: hypothetical protein VKA30_11775 [Actinomycetota bacterium]|nr:hypothetical protein [Actinomycetota bacterium]